MNRKVASIRLSGLVARFRGVVLGVPRDAMVPQILEDQLTLSLSGVQIKPP